MRTLPEVEQARQVMSEAAEWSVMKWLREKKRVRRLADEANAALDRLNRETKARWPAEWRAAWNRETRHDAALPLLARVRQADELAMRVRQEAEDTFDEAERQLSARLAREGCGKALRSWELHEQAIRRAEEAMQRAAQQPLSGGRP